MSAFDECTLAEVELMTATCLNGKSMGDDAVDPLLVAGGVMWITARRATPDLSWQDFKANTKMGDIKAFSQEMNDDAMDPTNGHVELVT